MQHQYSPVDIDRHIALDQADRAAARGASARTPIRADRRRQHLGVSVGIVGLVAAIGGSVAWAAADDSPTPVVERQVVLGPAPLKQ